MPVSPDHPLSVEDTYFLDRRQAEAAALRKQRLRLNNGRERLQYCYHPGPEFPNAPENLILLPLDKFIEYFCLHPDRIPTRLACDLPGISAKQRETVRQDFQILLDELQQILSQKTQATTEHFDTLFLDSSLALATARQRNRVNEGHPRITGLQICYYSGHALREQLENLIHIPEDQFLDFFCHTRLRLPRRIIFPPQITPQTQGEISKTFSMLLGEANKFRDKKTMELGEACRRLRPELTNPHGPFRIFLPSCRLTEVMQYCSKNLAKAFTRLGHQALLSMERNDMEQLPLFWRLQEQLEFNPHVVVNINHLANQWLPEEVFNVVWWQDPMAEIMAGKQLPWRKRDIALSVDPLFDDHIRETGVGDVLRQHFCVDTEVFKPDPHIRKQERLVFVGSSYFNKLVMLPAHERKVMEEARQRLNRGDFISAEEVRRQISDQTLAMWGYNYLVRDSVVRWACELPDVTVDVYGRGWEHDAVVMSRFRGELPHGEAVAKVYQEASHALVAMPWSINTQRLAEIAACGCIPVVYDVRCQAESPHWDTECQFFTTKEELAACLKRDFSGNPLRIAAHCTYETMAQRIISLVRDRLEKSS